MRCKECKEKIPDYTTKYCPECGALINNIKYTIDNTKKYAPPVNQNTYSDLYNDKNAQKQSYNDFYGEEKNRQKKQTRTFSGFPGKSVISVVIIIFFILFCAITAFEELEFNNLFSVEEEIIFPDNEISILTEAQEYINCFTQFDASFSYDNFNNYSAINWDAVFSDKFAVSDDDYYTEGRILAEAKFNDFISESQLSSKMDFSSCIVTFDGFSPADEKIFFDAGMKINKYFPSVDEDTINSLYTDYETYIVTGEIDFCDYKTGIMCIEEITLFIIGDDTFCEVLYDNIFTDAFLKFATGTEEESSTL